MELWGFVTTRGINCGIDVVREETFSEVGNNGAVRALWKIGEVDG